MLSETSHNIDFYYGDRVTPEEAKETLQNIFSGSTPVNPSHIIRAYQAIAASREPKSLAKTTRLMREQSGDVVFTEPE